MSTEAEQNLFAVFDKVAAKYEPPKEDDMIILDGNPQIQQQNNDQKNQDNLTKKQRKYEDTQAYNNGNTKDNMYNYNAISTCDDSTQNQTSNNKRIIIENIGQEVEIQEKVYQPNQNNKGGIQDLHLNEDKINKKYQIQKQIMEQKQKQQKKIKQQQDLRNQKKSNNIINDDDQNENQIKTITKDDFKYKQQNKVTNILQDEEEIGEVGEMIGKTANQNLQNNDDSDIDSDQKQLQQNEDDEFDAAFEDGKDKQVEICFDKNKKVQELDQNTKQNNIFKKQEQERIKQAQEIAQKKANQKLKGSTTELGNRNGYMVNKLSNKAAIIKANETFQQQQQQINKQIKKNNTQNDEEVIKIDPKQIKETQIIQDIQEDEEDQEEQQQQQDQNELKNEFQIEQNQENKQNSIQQDNKETEDIGEDQDEDEDEEEDNQENENQDKFNDLENNKNNEFNGDDNLIMSPEEMRRRSSEKKKQVISEDEWDNITKETLKLQQQQKELHQNNQKSIQYIEAYNQVKTINLTNQMKQIHSEEINNQGFLARLFGFCSKGGQKINRQDLLTEKDRILAFSKIKFDDQDPFHFQMIYTIYSTLTNNENCLRYGNHWEDIGFQGTDPATDIRGGGMFGILQILAFVCKYKLLLQEALQYSQQEEYCFPLCCTLLNISVNVLQLLKMGKLNDMINNEKSVMNILNMVYFAEFHHFFTNYKKRSINIEQLGFCLKESYNLVESNPQRIVNDFKKKIDRYYKNNDI